MIDMPQSSASTAILLIAHGSRNAPANDDLHQLVARIAEQGKYPIVEACFLELAEPDIQAGGGRCVERGAARVLIVPYFLSAGVHLLRDLSAARDALSERHPGIEFRLGPALGPHPLLDRLVWERIGQLDGGRAASRLDLSSEPFLSPAHLESHGAAPFVEGTQAGPQIDPH
ncbi:MAG TPA: CbiX/SirB N-terminal domain-containing protein [Isosphaeraceae bacterium]|jgi:sirohydrochlorin ferrochelatase|nr:CbiX/SirB N-terminal domain-containing protein [Isosphaeraceae bacterium]